MGSVLIDEGHDVGAEYTTLHRNIRHTSRIVLSGAVDPRWAEVVAAAVRAEYLDLWRPDQRILDAIGRVLPRLLNLKTLTYSAQHDAPVVDLSVLFKGCNASPPLRTIDLISVRGVATTALAPHELRRIRVTPTCDFPELFEPLAGTHVTLVVTVNVPMPRTVRTIHERLPASIVVSYGHAATARECAARDFLDIRCYARIHIYKSTEPQLETDREFQYLRALFALATAPDGPAKRFVDGSGDGALLGLVRKFL